MGRLLSLTVTLAVAYAALFAATVWLWPERFQTTGAWMALHSYGIATYSCSVPGSSTPFAKDFAQAVCPDGIHWLARGGQWRVLGYLAVVAFVWWRVTHRREADASAPVQG